MNAVTTSISQEHCMRRILILLAILVAAGCSPNGPPLTPVSGVVTLGGQPLANAQVRFIPQGDTKGHGGAARTGEDGKYEVIANRMNNRKGLLPGQYKVVVSRLTAPDGTVLPPETKTAETATIESVPEP